MIKEIRARLRLSKELEDTLRELAKQHKRSFTSEIVWSLEQYIELAGKDETMNETTKETTMKAVVLSENTPRGNPSANARWGGSQDGTEMATWMQDGQWYGCLQGIYQGNWFEGEDQGPFDTREEAEASLREDYAESQQPQQDIYPSEIE